MKVVYSIRNKDILKDFWIAGFLFLIFWLPFFSTGFEGKDIFCIISFIINGISFLIGMFRAQKKYSISVELIYWIFMFFFMYFAPLIQYLESKYPWRGSFTNKEILKINTIIFLFNLCFVIGKMISKRFRIKLTSNLKFAEYLCESFEFKKKSRLIVTIVVCLLAIYSFSKTGLMGIVVARIQATNVFYAGDNTAIELIVESVIPAFVSYVVVEAAQEMINKKENGIRFILLLICLIICFFPTTIPRYKTATIYGTLLLVLFPKIKKGSRFFWIFICALFFAFPILNSVRRIISMESFQSVFADGFLSIYVEADYDAYRMLGSAVKYNQLYGCRWGYQLLGALLFFIPRSMWHSKPGGSGAMLIRTEFGDVAFANVSCPFVAEGYLNFGIVGVILFAMFLGVLIHKMDKYYWKYAIERKNVVFSPYLFIVFMMFFVLRGDLLSGFAYVCGFTVTGYILRSIARRV